MSSNDMFLRIPTTLFFKNWLFIDPLRKIIAAIIMYICMFSTQYFILKYEWGMAVVHSSLISVLFTTF
jgi:hypothetical protein